MKITILPDSFRHERENGEESKKFELDIKFDAQEFSRYLEVKKKLTQAIQEDKGECCDDHGVTVLLLRYTNDKFELAPRKILQGIALHLQELGLLNMAQYTALKDASALFVMRERNHQYEGCAFELTNKGVDFTLKSKPGPQFSQSVTVTQTIAYPKIKKEDKRDEVQPSVSQAPGLGWVGC